MAGVTWHGSQFFCRAQNERARSSINPISLVNWSVNPTIAGWRLPTDAEWEYAARGGYGKAKYPWWTADNSTHKEPNEFPANFNNGAGTLPVGNYAVNGCGLHDMAGKAREWCSDLYDDTAYAGAGLVSVSVTSCLGAAGHTPLNTDHGRRSRIFTRVARRNVKV